VATWPDCWLRFIEAVVIPMACSVTVKVLLSWLAPGSEPIVSAGIRNKASRSSQYACI
jgi:hypothetical protein